MRGIVLWKRGAQMRIGHQRDMVLGVEYQARILGVVVVGSEKKTPDPLGC